MTEKLFTTRQNSSNEKLRKVNERQIDFLKSCPFCGSSDTRLHIRIACNHSYVRCEECLVRTRRCNSINDAISVWNKRADESEEYELAFVNGWLDSARFDDRLTGEEQDACWTVLNAIARIQGAKE